MPIAALVVFALAALGGLALAVIRFRTGSNPPLAIAAVHGAAAATGLVLLGLAASEVAFTGSLVVSLGVLVVAALGGFLLIGLHLSGRTIPIGIVGVHALVAVAGFLVLLAAVVA